MFTRWIVMLDDAPTALDDRKPPSPLTIMSQTSRPDIPDTEYRELEKFIIKKVQEKAYAGQGIYQRDLIRHYLDEQCDRTRLLEDQDFKLEQVRFVTRLLRYMLHEEILKVIPRREGGTAFIIHPRNSMVGNSSPMVDSSQITINGGGQPEHSSTFDADDSGVGMDNGDESSGESVLEKQQMRSTIAETQQDDSRPSSPIALANACAKVTRLAQTSRAPTVEPLTPSKKRNRYEIADSNASSRIDSLSSRQSPIKRQATPDEVCRRSAPSRTGTPCKKTSPLGKQVEIKGYDGVSAINFKDEKSLRDLWGEKALKELQQQYPEYANYIYFRKNDGCFVCEPCPMSAKSDWRTTKYFTQHLKGQKHVNGVALWRAKQQNIERDLEKLEGKLPPPPPKEPENTKSLITAEPSSKAWFATESPIVTKPSFMNQFIMPQNIQVFSVPVIYYERPANTDTSTGSLTSAAEPVSEDATMQALSVLQSQLQGCIGAIAHGVNAKLEHNKLLEGTLTSSKEQQEKDVASMRESITAMELQAKREAQENENNRTSLEARYQAKMAELDQESSKARSRNEEEIARLKELLVLSQKDNAAQAEQWEKQLESFHLASNLEVEKIESRLAVHQIKSGEELTTMTGRIYALETERETLKADRDAQIELVNELEATSQLHSEQLKAHQGDQKALLHKIEANSKNNTELYNGLQIEIERMAAAEKEQAKQLVLTETKLDGLRQQSDEKDLRLESLQRETSQRIQSLNMATSARISSLEGDLSLMRQEFAATDMRIQAMEKAHADKIKRLEATLAELQATSEKRIKDLEEATSANVQKIELLEEDNEAQVEKLNTLAPMIFKEMNRLKQIVEEAGRKVDERKPAKRRLASERVARSVRKTMSLGSRSRISSVSSRKTSI